MPNKAKKQPKKRRSILLPIILVVILAGCAGAYAVYHHHSTTINAKDTSAVAGTRPENSIYYGHSQPSDNDANNQRKSTASSSSSSTGDTLNTPSTTPSFSVTISRAEASGEDISTAANVNGVTSGTCTFNFSTTQGGAAVTSSQAEQVVESNQSASCPPVNVQMPSSGTWYVSVSVVNNGATATNKWAGPPPVTS